MMNIGICIIHKEEGLEESFRKAAEMNFRFCQLISWNPALWTDEEASTVNRLCGEYGITVTEFWCGWEGPTAWNFTQGPALLGIVPEAYRARRVQNLKDGADFAKKLGVSDVVSHMGFLPENMTDPAWEGVCAAVREVAEHLKGNGQNLLFETGQETPVVLLRLFEELNTGNLYVNLDPANLILYGKANPVDAMDVIGDYVRGVHAKDGVYPVNGRQLGTETRLGDGKVSFPRLLRSLKAHGYSRTLTIEREISGEKQIEDIEHARRLLRHILEEMENE